MSRFAVVYVNDALATVRHEPTFNDLDSALRAGHELTRDFVALYFRVVRVP